MKNNYTVEHESADKFNHDPKTGNFKINVIDGDGNKIAHLYAVNRENNVSLHNFYIHPGHVTHTQEICQLMRSYAEQVSGKSTCNKNN